MGLTFFFLLHWLGISVKMLKTSGDNEHMYLIPNFGGKLQHFINKFNVYTKQEFGKYTLFSSIFYILRVLL